MTPPLPLLPTTLVGSYPRPDWLVDKQALMASGPPRMRMREVWRAPEDELDLDLAVLAGLPSNTIIRGALDLSRHEVETAATVARRIRAALEYVPPERLIVAPDCGMKYLPRDAAFGKLCALVEGARMVRAEIGE